MVLQSGCVAVAGDRILAGDLAPYVQAFAGLDPQTVIGYAPLPGLERRLTRNDLQRALGEQGSAGNLPASLCVVRLATRVDAEVVRKEMQARLPEDAQLDLVEWSSAALPAGRPEFALTGLRRTPEPGRYIWRGRWIPDRGGRSAPIAAVVRIRLSRPVLVAARDLAAGEALAHGDLKTEVREVALPAAPAAAEVRDLSGYRTRRPIAAGQAVEPAYLVPPEAARAGQPITLVCESGAARIAVEAQALTAGRLGGVILVKSPLNGKRVRARLDGPGRAVAVEGPGRVVAEKETP
jgi:flagella basal body P-ring formation protein FlgA